MPSRLTGIIFTCSAQKRKPYDAGGIYHPLAEKEKSSDEIRLCDVGPKVRNKYLFLYDFGDEWVFYVTVMQVRETEHEIMPRVAEEEDRWISMRPGFLRTNGRMMRTGAAKVNGTMKMNKWKSA